jgi:hypothetical protein
MQAVAAGFPFGGGRSDGRIQRGKIFGPIIVNKPSPPHGAGYSGVPGMCGGSGVKIPYRIAVRPFLVSIYRTSKTRKDPIEAERKRQC